MLVICPTRELALQAAAEANKLLKYHPSIGVQAVIGGTRLTQEQRHMQANPCQVKFLICLGRKVSAPFVIGLFHLLFSLLTSIWLIDSNSHTWKTQRPYWEHNRICQSAKWSENSCAWWSRSSIRYGIPERYWENHFYCSKTETNTSIFCYCTKWGMFMEPISSTFGVFLMKSKWTMMFTI